MSVLITGGAGYIGSVIVEKLHNAGESIIVIDDLRDGHIEAIPPGVNFYFGSFGDTNLLEEIFQTHKIKTVFHLAASSSVPDSVINPGLYYQNNIANSINLLTGMAKAGIAQIIFSSSASVYGEPVSLPIDEEHPLKPINPYGKTKLFLEEIIKDLAIANNIRFIFFRYFCAAGATDLHGESRKNESHLVPVIIDHVLGKRNSIPVFGTDFSTNDGTGVRDYIHVSDIADAHLLGLRMMESVVGSTFNIGTHLGVSVLEMIKTAEEIFSKHLKVEYHNRREGDPAILVASNKKITNQLGWSPKHDIKSILSSAFAWRRNPRY